MDCGPRLQLGFDYSKSWSPNLSLENDLQHVKGHSAAAGTGKEELERKCPGNIMDVTLISQAKVATG